MLIQYAFALLAAFTLRSTVFAQETTIPDSPGGIRVSADISHQWKEADGAMVSVMRGNCRVEQGETSIVGRQMVVWQSKVNGRDRVELYLEDDVRISRPGSTRSFSRQYLDLWSQSGVTYKARWPREHSEPVVDPLLGRATAQRKESSRTLIQQAQLLELPPPGFNYSSFRQEDSNAPVRRIRLYARTGQSFSVKSEKSTQTTPVEQIAIISGGIKLNVDSPTPDGIPDPKAMELAADSMVIWTEATELSDLSPGTEKLQTRDTPLQIYLEGNIVIRQQGKTLRADRAYYDARNDRALLLDAELSVYVPQAQSRLRVRANRIRQLTEGSFHAQEAWMSASHFGQPGYRLEASDIFFEPRVINPWVHSQGGWIDPITGEVDDGEINWLTTLNNRFVVGDTPVFFSPYLSGPAEDPHLPIKKVAVRSDRIFGTQIRTAWDPFHLLSRDAPEELSSSLLLDWYSRRGPGAGLEGAYDGEDLFGIVGKYKGDFHTYYVNDHGRDNLGLGRNGLEPGDDNRGRVQIRHRHDLPGNMSLFGEVGYGSDRNFLEQWYEDEFDRQKDNETRLMLEQKFDNVAWSILAQPQLNDYENTTEWYPKGDIFALAEPILGSPVTWTSHSSAGYAKLNRADAPSNPADIFTPLPYYGNVNGEVIMTRSEVTLPFTAGPFVVAPFAMGEIAHWGEDLTGNSLDRFVGSGGVRGSLTMSQIFPYVQSQIFNLNGLAHRMVFDMEYSYTDSSDNITNVAQYNALDDNAQERFQQRLPGHTFGGAIPTAFNARRYAIRSGAGSLVTTPWHELVDDLHVLRAGWHHRLQTKVGPPDRQRIRDWMTLDLEGSWFPNSGRHNPTGKDFAEDFGLLSARYKWLLSERTALLAGGLYDTFDGGQQLWNFGLLSQRSARGSVYAGVREIKGQGVDSQIATGSMSYLFSEKWAGTASTAYDLSEGQNRGQSLSLTRIGADFLFHFGFSFDQSKDSVGLAIALEPRFGPRTPYSSQMDNLLQIQ
ncbi:MAG: lipopolysaccharide export system protein LptA [Planctomycetaceae bacterium]|jgi:lipopolysaccharide export system protein LptA